jgi:hypothetical protein
MWAYWKLKPTVVCAAARAEHRNGFSISDRMHGNHVSACQHGNWQALAFRLRHIKTAKEEQDIKH